MKAPRGTIHRFNHFVEISENLEISTISEKPFFAQYKIGVEVFVELKHFHTLKVRLVRSTALFKIMS